ncbi:MAG: hypothetical protein HY281_12285 [Nitrospirae bacterium]|nr:hypothetical protein [Nitrospirota bacterium]
MRIIIAIFLASGISGCSTWYVLSNMNELDAHIKNVNEAWRVASERLDAMCREDPDSCRIRLVRSDVAWTSYHSTLTTEQRLKTSLWERKLRPPYRTTLAVREEELRRHTQARLAEEYVLGAGRMLADLLDDGKMSEEAGAAVFDQAQAQRFEMIKEDIRTLHESYVAALEQDRTTLYAFASLVSLSAHGLNAYAAARFPARVRVANQPTIVAPNLNSVTNVSPASILQCTPRLNALGGMMLCVTSDGKVVAQ